MKKNGFAPILIILVIAILGVVGYFVYQNTWVKNAFISSINSEKQEIILEENRSIYTYNLSTRQKTKLPITGLAERIAKTDPKKENPTDIRDLSLSPDKNKLYFNIGLDPVDFYIYNFSTKKTKILNDLGPNARPVQFSPNGKYAILDTGCCPGERGRILISVDGNLIDRDYGTSFAWSPDSTSYILCTGDISLTALEYVYETLHNGSIYLKRINNLKVSSTKLFSADYQHSFSVVGWQDNNNILLKRTDFNQPFPSNPTFSQKNDQDFQNYWEKIYNNAKTIYFKFNLVDKTINNITQPDENKIDVNDKTISSDGKLKIIIDVFHPKNGQPSLGTIYLSGIGGSNKIKIGDGYSAVWR